MPLDELAARLDVLPADAHIVVYCRGRYWTLADDAARLLTAAGRRVTRLDDGDPEWRAEGRPTASGG